MTYKYKTFEQIVDHIVEEIQALPDRRRLGKDLPKLTASVTKLIRDSAGLHLTRARHQEASIHKGAGYYSSNRYNKTHTYRIHINRAFEGMIELGYIFVTKKGASDGSAGKFLTRYVATSKLTELFVGISPETISALLPPLDPNAETIICQEKNYSGLFNKQGCEITHKVLLDYKDNTESQRMRQNLAQINKVLAKSWFDLDVTPAEMEAVEEEIRKKSKENDYNLHINYANRSLHRTFNNIEFTHGGRFYGGWWELVPSRLRSRIVINGKRTEEYDYSGLHPNMLYAMEGKALPSDPYDDLIKDVLGDDAEEVRKICKKAFNAMLNASQKMKGQPKGMRLSDYGTNWANLSAAIMERHKPIAHYFCTGFGKKLQRIDSDMAEEVMLFFANEGVPVLPSHDSFTMHQGYQEDLQKVMGEVFRDRFGQEIGIKLECKMPYAEGDGEILSMSIEDILSGLEGDCDQRLELFRGL
ncbi:hypothetical protein N9E93_03835 [Oceanospirillaceae bacterium]|nr:hypothetical protein [Oceanospirillaceae bacterium]